MKLFITRRKMRRRRLTEITWDKPAGQRPELPLRHGEPCCEPGQDWNADGHCAWHSLHYPCDACAGWYGVPHDIRGCHSMQALSFLRGTAPPPGSTRPWPEQCACRYCKLTKLCGAEYADAYFRDLVNR